MPEPSDAVTDLPQLAEELLGQAADSPARRAARTLPHPQAGLRQTVLALCAGAELAEHEAPGAATLHVVLGRVRLTTADGKLELRAGQLAPVPAQRHGLRAEQDSVVLLTVAAG
jgi:quercetin dioxygenase-like cupin family protein